MSTGYRFFDHNNYNEKKIQLKKPMSKKIGDDTYHFIPIRYKNQEIYIKTPKIVVPFGLNTYTSEQNEQHYYFVISFTDMDIDPNINKFYQFLQKMEIFCQNMVKLNMSKWGCDYLFEGLSFKSSFKEADGAIPLFKLKINSTGKQQSELYNEYGESILMHQIDNHITERCQVISLLELSNIWIKPTEYGITWKVQQIRIYPSNKPIGGVSLLDENIEIHNVKMVEHIQSIPMVPPLDDNPFIPDAPPLDIDSTSIVTRHIPIGGRAILPFLSMIGNGQTQLKKVDTDQILLNKLKKNDNMPLISLDDILKMKDRLKKSKQ